MRHLAAALALSVVSTVVVPLEWGSRPRVPATLDFVLLWVVGGAAALGAAWQARFHRLFTLILLGVTGVVVCVTFAWFSAPDLALTQIAVESVTLLFFLLGLRWLPKPVVREGEARRAWRSLWRRSRDLVLCLLAGAGLGAVSYALLTRTGARVVSNDACKEGCSRQYAPVCGTDSAGTRRTYGNACEAERAGAAVVRNRGCQGVLGRR